MDHAPTEDAVAAVLLAGGASTRFDHDLGKVLVPLGGRPLLGHSLATLDRSPVVDHVVLVLREADRPAVDRVVRDVAPAKLRCVVTGGATRHESETAGLDAVRRLEGVRWVMLHDAARPFVTHDLLERLVRTAAERGVGVVPGIAFEEPVVDVEGHLVDTAALVRMQTPQLFPLDEAHAAYAAAAADDFDGVDTAETLAAYGHTSIEHVVGDPRNLKVTTIDDLHVAQHWVHAWDDGRWRDRPEGAGA